MNPWSATPYEPCDPYPVRRLALALALALGLHALLLSGLVKWPTLHLPLLHHLNVVLLPPVTQPAAPSVPPMPPGNATIIAAAPEIKPVPAADTTPIPETAPAPAPAPAPEIKPVPVPTPTVEPQPAPVTPPRIVTPTPIRPVAPRSTIKPVEKTVAKPVTPPRPVEKTVAKPVAKPVTPPRPATPIAKLSAPSSTKPAESPPAPVAKPPAPVTKPAASAPVRPAAPAASRATGASSSARSLDSSALLGQIAVIETENQRQANADSRVRRANPRDTGSLEGFYAAAWVRKVENIGEMNFPEVARRLNLSTGPVLDVAIRADGTVQEIRVLRSSGNAELDQAAQRIVRLGAPYAPFPPALRQQYDLLRISRSWRFDPDGRLSGR